MKTSATNSIIAKKPPGIDLGSWIAGELRRIDGVEARVRLVLRKAETARKSLDEQIKKCDDELREISDSCPHYSTTRFADPAGGSDSHTACDHCRKEWR